MKSFLTNLSLRPSCYNCHSKSLKRESDITLADFWGIENVAPEMDDDKGTSLVFVNSEKGKELFEEILNGMIYKEVDINEAAKYNSAAYESVKMPKNREKFMKLIDNAEFDVAVKKCIPKKCFIRRVALKSKRLLKKFLKK